MSDDRKSVSVKITDQMNDAIEKWMSETTCSRQVAMSGLLVKGAKEMGVWSDEPHVRASHSVRIDNHRCSTYDEGTNSTRRVSATTEENSQSDDFSEFWYSIPKQFKRGTREEAKKKWNSKRVANELLKGGLKPSDIASRYVSYFKASKGEGYAGIKFVKHVSNWLDAFGFHDEMISPEDVVDRGHYDLDLT
tara:strand:- start:652 stop:1227 length:576 start_codon:yes stop_codon:yes gene_type:complete